jgi:hypothetical protein
MDTSRRGKTLVKRDWGMSFVCTTRFGRLTSNENGDCKNERKINTLDRSRSGTNERLHFVIDEPRHDHWQTFVVSCLVRLLIHSVKGPLVSYFLDWNDAIVSAGTDQVLERNSPQTEGQSSSIEHSFSCRYCDWEHCWPSSPPYSHGHCCDHSSNFQVCLEGCSSIRSLFAFNC